MLSFVGRERELEELLEAVETLPGGQGRLFMISGEPGVGKSRLADELSARAAERGATVAWGGAWDGGGAPAFWPWTQIVRRVRAFLPEPDERLRRELGPVWDEVPRSGEPEESGSDPEVLRFRRFDALRAVLKVAAGREKLVIVLDDLHAADQGSLLALQFVAQALRSLPVLLLATHRRAPVDSQIANLIARIARHGRTLALGGLARSEIEQMLATLDPVTPRLVDDIYRTSGGNPLFVSEAVRAARMGGRVAEAPVGVAPVIRARLSQLDEPSKRTLEAAAVLGREVAIELLSEVCGRRVEELRSWTRAPGVVGVIEPAGAETVRFSHSLFREQLYEELETDRRASLHLAAAEALMRRAASRHEALDEPIARHLLAALPAGDPARAFHSAVRAARSARAALAFDRAAELFEGALRLLVGSPGEVTERIDIELDLAEVLALGGAAERGRAICLTAAERARRGGDWVRFARAALAYGAELRLAFVDRTLVGLLEEAREALGERAPALRAQVMARLAAAQQPAIDPAPPMRLARQAIELARQHADPQTLLAVIHAAGSALVDYAAPEERQPLARELVTLALPRGELVLAQQGYARLAIDTLELCDLPGADLAILAHERLGDALGHPRWRWRGALMRSMRALMDGRFDDADRAQAEAVAFAEQSDDPNALPALSLHRMGALRTREAASPEMLASPWDLSLDTLEIGGLAGLGRGALLGRLGDVEGARRVLRSTPIEHPNFDVDPMTITLGADIATSTADRRWAERLLPALGTIRERTLSWGVFGLIWDGPVAQWTGSLLAVLGRFDEAVGELEESLAIAEAIAARPLAARLRQLLAQALFGRACEADSAHALALLDAAEREANALGMTHLSKRISVTRGEASQTARSTAPEPPDPATPMPFSMTREGELWAIASGVRVLRIRHSRGLELLDVLVKNPDREFHVLDLGASDPSDVVDAGDAGETLDTRAKDAYRRRIGELEEELVEAEAWADAGRRDRLFAELEFLREELARGVGLGGRDRRAAGATERARVNVQKRLTGAVKKIGEAFPELGRHLDYALKTGTYVSYRRRI